MRSGRTAQSAADRFLLPRHTSLLNCAVARFEVRRHAHADHQHFGAGSFGQLRHFQFAFAGCHWRSAQAIVATRLNHYQRRLVLDQQRGQPGKAAGLMVSPLMLALITCAAIFQASFSQQIGQPSPATSHTADK